MSTLLLVIDLQVGWRHKTATEEVMLDTASLCKQFTGDVIHCCFRNNPDSLFYTQLHWSEFTGPPDTDQIPEIAKLNLPLYWRETYSCLTPEITQLIKKYDHIYIAGVFTDISVLMTAMAIFDLNIPVSVVGDCVATLHGEDVHQAAMRSLSHAIGYRHIVTAKSLQKPVTEKAKA
jgi:nicotinamidase-related amidase